MARPKSTTSWDSLVSALREDAPNRVDYNHLRFGDLEVNPGLDTAPGDLPVASMSYPLEDGTRVHQDLTDRSYGQYLGKLDIPRGFAVKFSPRLQADMIAERVLDKNMGDKPISDASVFLRTRPNLVRAMLSGRYGDMPDLRVAEIVDGLLGKDRLAAYDVFKGTVQDHVFSVTLLGRDTVHRNGDDYFPILRIGNSEVGASSYWTETGICKGACSNGMIFSHIKDASVRIRHLGKNMSESVEVALDKVLGSADEWAARVVPAIDKAHGIRINLEDERERRRLVKRLRDRGVTKRFADKALNLAVAMPEETYGAEFAPGQVITLWTAVNAMTHLAQALEPEDQYAVESAAGALLLAA